MKKHAKHRQLVKSNQAQPAVATFNKKAILFYVSMMFASNTAHANPTGGEFAAGAGAISTLGNLTTVQQNTQRAIVNWQSFGTNAGEAVKFMQPSANAAILNRVVGNLPSNLNGLLEGNGRVYLINPNGIVLGQNGVINVNGGFVASTQNISDSAFMQGGALLFTGENTGNIEILGKIQSAQGDIVIIAPKTEIAAGAELKAGQSIQLIAANEVELSNGKITVKPKATDAGQITVEGALKAAQVQLEAHNNNLGALAINTTGTIRATGTQTNPDGSVTIMAYGEGSNIKVSGNIAAQNNDASQQGGRIIVGRNEETGELAKSADVSGARFTTNKGFVETSGDYLVTTGTRVFAKDWLLDPTDITITSGTTTSPNWTTPQSSSTILAEDISYNLNQGTNVNIQTASSGTQEGKISVDADIIKTTATGATTPTLKLNAAGRILVNKDIKVDRAETGNNLNLVMNTTNGGIVVANGVTLDMNQGDLTMNANIGSSGSQSTTGIIMGSSYSSSGSGATTTAGKAIIKANQLTINVTNDSAVSSSYATYLGCTEAFCQSTGNIVDVQVNKFTLSSKPSDGVLSSGNGVVLGRNFLVNATDTISITSTSKYDAIWAPVGRLQAKTISLTGTSTDGVGVALYPYSTLTSTAGGNGITITGKAESNTKDGVQLYGRITNNGNGATTIKAEKGDINFDMNGAITNASTAGAITVQADDGSIKYGSNWANPLTQNSDKGITLKAKGDVSVPKIVNKGTGDVVIVAGNGIAAGTGTGGQVLTNPGRTITNDNSKTYIYSGSIASTGALSNLGIFSDLWLDGAGKNIQMSTASDGLSNIANTTAKHQVMFRESGSFNFGNALQGATYTTSYGDAHTQVGQENALWSDVTAKLKQNNTGNTLSATLGGNTVKISAATLIDTLTGTLGATNSTDYSTSQYLKANDNGYAYNNVLSSQYTVGLKSGEEVRAVIAKKDVTLASITANNKTYDGNTNAVISAGAITGTVGTETLLVSGTGSFDTKNAGTDKTVTINDVTALSKTNSSGDWSNYNLTTTGHMTTRADITKNRTANVVLTANSGTAVYNGTTQGVSGITSASGLLGDDTVNNIGVTASTSGKNAGTYTNTVFDNKTALENNYANVTYNNGTFTIKVNTPSAYGYTSSPADAVVFSPVSFGLAYAGGATAAGGEVEGSCDAWSQRAGAGSISLMSVLKPSYMGLRNAKTDTMDAMAGTQALGAPTNAAENPCASAAQVERQAKL